jgi:hypothetical protein
MLRNPNVDTDGKLVPKFKLQKCGVTLGLDSCDTGQAFPRSCHLKVLGLTFHHEQKRQVRRGVVVCAQGTALT